MPRPARTTKKCPLYIPDIGEKRNFMLKKLSEISMKPQTALIREALDLLFKSPGGQI